MASTTDREFKARAIVNELEAYGVRIPWLYKKLAEGWPGPGLYLHKMMALAHALHEHMDRDLPRSCDLAMSILHEAEIFPPALMEVAPDPRRAGQTRRVMRDLNYPYPYLQRR